MIVAIIQMKIHKSLNVVSEVLSFLYKMISWIITWHIIFVELRKIHNKNWMYCKTSKDGDGRHPRFGFAILSPVLLSTIFVLVHWWKTESNLKNKLITLPLVICQIWPQYRIARILYLGLIKQNRKWQVENEDQKKNVSSLGIVILFWWHLNSELILSFISEPFIEAVPQMHILLILFMLNPLATYFLNPNLFIATFTTSVFTATLGIAKFLKIGPCRLIPDQGPLGGHGTLAFLMLMLNIASSIVSKGIMLPAIGFGAFEFFGGGPISKSPSMVIGVWIAICYLPQLVYVSF